MDVIVTLEPGYRKFSLKELPISEYWNEMGSNRSAEQIQRLHIADDN